MKIAVCFSGQWRTGNYCYDNLKRFFGILYPYCDFFIHTWDVNKQKCYNLSNVFSKEKKLKDDEITLIHENYKPKKIIVEDYNHIHNTLINYEDYLSTNVKVFDIIQPLWYSFWKSIELKKQYEIDNGFEYDYVIKLRADIIFNPNRRLSQDIESYMNEINENGFYIENIMREWDINSDTVDDVYFISKSKQMDIAATYYNQWLEWGISNRNKPFYGFIRHLILNGLKVSSYKERKLGGESGYVPYRPECLEIGTNTIDAYYKCKVCDEYYYGNPKKQPSVSPDGYYIDLLKSKHNISDDVECYYIDELKPIKKLV